MGKLEVPSWLKRMPLAPVFYPTETEFTDPIAYISKIEKEASIFGICKVIPPFPKPSKQFVFSNINRSLSKNLSDGQCCSTNLDHELDGGKDLALFTTRQQELGKSQKKVMSVSSLRSGVCKHVWESGAFYTLDQFESKAMKFARSQLRNRKEVSPSVIETLFWEATFDEPIYVEYANDVPGSGFQPQDALGQNSYKQKGSKNPGRRSVGSGKCGYGNDLPVEIGRERNISCMVKCSTNEKTSVNQKLSNSPWNLQVIARSSGSLTRFMPDNIPGVTSPMVYIGMLFSWFAWHVEDHELHSLNFLHMGSPKTWYAVPNTFAFDLEEIIRVDGYGGVPDRLCTLSLLGEKTTLLSPETVVASGIPCCRLVQYPGEYVVTFPRAYHIGFSHGFNIGEAANFATSEWLKVAKEAAVRRAAMGHLPMLSHQLLLYSLVMSFISRLPRHLLPDVRNSRSKDRRQEEKESLVKKEFISDFLKENLLLAAIRKKKASSRVVMWYPDMIPLQANDPEEKAEETLYNSLGPMESNIFRDVINGGKNDYQCCFHVDSGALACVACGLLGFPFMSIVQPSDETSMILFSGEANKAVIENARYSDPGKNHIAQSTGCQKSSESADSKMICLKGGTRNSLSKPYCKQNAKTLIEEVRDMAREREKWNISSSFLRPRVFCLEHALEIEKTLEGNGGVNVLLICLADYSRVKEAAIAISDENCIQLDDIDVPLTVATQRDLDLIYISVDGDDDVPKQKNTNWTSVLGLDLMHTVKATRECPFTQARLRLHLRGLFPNKNFFLKMQSGEHVPRKRRTIHKKKCASRFRFFMQGNQVPTSMLSQENCHEQTHGQSRKDQLGEVTSSTSVVFDEGEVLPIKNEPKGSDTDPNSLSLQSVCSSISDDQSFPHFAEKRLMFSSSDVTGLLNSYASWKKQQGEDICPTDDLRLDISTNGAKVERINELCESSHSGSLSFPVVRAQLTGVGNIVLNPALNDLPPAALSESKQSKSQTVCISSEHAKQSEGFATKVTASVFANLSNEQNTRCLEDASVIESYKMDMHRTEPYVRSSVKLCLEPSFVGACDSMGLDGRPSADGGNCNITRLHHNLQDREKFNLVYKRKRKKTEAQQQLEKQLNCHCFVRGPCEGLRPRSNKGRMLSVLRSKGK